jgi:DNA invertase Pin-like site-specific DNA recombinase
MSRALAADERFVCFDVGPDSLSVPPFDDLGPMFSFDTGKSKGGPMRAAQYVRMSTEHQQYSIENQEAAIAAYASSRDFEIVKTYADHARSGLDLAGRPGLKALLEDVIAGRIDFGVVLVYDVSRWGRFQDADESAHYEFLCKRAGVRVHYCAELFPNDDSFGAVLLKTVKRTMAAEYIRELSAKTFAGQCRIARNGYKMGSPPGYGLRRVLVGSEGAYKATLHPGEWKSITTDRVKYAPGNEEEMQVVRNIYSMFIDGKMGLCQIAHELNATGVSRDGLRPWDNQAVRTVLYKAKYAGYMVFNQTSKRMGGKTIRNPREQWIVVPHSFPAIISPERFQEAERRRLQLTNNKSTGQILADLRSAVKRHGRLSQKIIGADPELPCVTTYVRRLGGLRRAYELIGYDPPKGVKWIDERRKRTEVRNTIERELLRLLSLQMNVQLEGRTVVIAGRVSLAIQVAHAVIKKRAAPRWMVAAVREERQCSRIVARIARNEEGVQDYFLLDRLTVPSRRLTWPDEYFRNAGPMSTTLSDFAALLVAWVDGRSE